MEAYITKSNLLSLHNLFLERASGWQGGVYSVSLNEGEILLLRGANGSGKTTLLHYMAGIFPSNHVQRSREVIFLPTTFALFEEKTVEENIHAFARSLHATSMVHAAIARFDLVPILHKTVESLSTGQKRRVSISRLVYVPDRLWLLDEPELGLDKMWQGALLTLLTEHRGRGGAAVIASHSGWYEDLTRCDVLKMHAA